jgi:hypothetical protein
MGAMGSGCRACGNPGARFCARPTNASSIGVAFVGAGVCDSLQLQKTASANCAKDACKEFPLLRITDLDPLLWFYEISRNKLSS